MKKNYLYLAFIITSLFISGCENLYNDAYDSANPNVYVVGYERDAASSLNAIYWKNGAMVRLTDYPVTGPYAQANSVFVYKGKAYIAVTDDNKACYSIDGGELNYLSGGTEANSMFVYKDDIYVSGRNSSNAGLWKNNVSVYLSGELTCAAYSVFVYNDDTYVAGTDLLSGNSAKNWFNSSSSFLTDGTIANSVFVHNGDVYIVGFDSGDNTGKFWLNSVIQSNPSFPADSAAFSVFVYNDDVYIAGYVKEGKMKAVYWKNGEKKYLTDGTYSAQANSIFVYNGDIYVAGWEEKSGPKEIAKYWKNGKAVTLYNGGYNSRATSIFVSDE